MAVARKPEPGTLGARIDEVREVLSQREGKTVSRNEVGKRAGLEDGHISKVVNSKGRVSTEVQQKIAAGLGVSLLWLSTGQGSMFGSDAEATPPPPAARRERAPVEHAFSDEIEDLALVVVKRPGAPDYKAKHTTPAKVFFAQAKPRMDLGKRPALMAAAIDAAYSLVEEDGVEPTPSAILARLMERAAPTYSRQEQATIDAFEARLAEADAELDAEEAAGAALPSSEVPPSPPPAAPAPSTTRKKKATG